MRGPFVELELGPDRSRHIPALDGVRGLAILLVLLCHFMIWHEVPSWTDKLPAKLAASGWIGVDLFFVLSGFLITGILYDARGKPGYFRRFYTRRVLRIFPLYYGFLAFIFFVLPGSHPHQLWWWGYASNVFLAMRQGWTGPSEALHFWSLAVEEQFYLVWPFIVLAASHRRLLRICLGCMIVAPLLRLGLLLAGSDGIAGYVLAPTRMDALAAGALVALLLRERALWDRWNRRAPKIAMAAATGLVVLFVARRGLGSADPWVECIGYTLIAALFAVFVGRAAVVPEAARLHRVLAHPALGRVGKYSYGMYVFHPIITTGLVSIGFTDHLLPVLGGSLIPAKMTFAIGAGLATFGVAALSWHAFESRFLRPLPAVPVGIQHQRQHQMDGGDVDGHKPTPLVGGVTGPRNPIPEPIGHEDAISDRRGTICDHVRPRA